MRTRNYVIGGLCSAVIVAHGASTPGGNDPAVGDDGLDVVPEDNLKDMRGGMDLGNLVGYFAIDRVVEVDGQVVAKMQIVVSNLDKISTGGMPTVTVSGPLSQLVQVMNGPAGAGNPDALPAAVVAAAKTVAEPHSTSAGVSGASGAAGSAAAGAAGQSLSVTLPSGVVPGTANAGSAPGGGTTLQTNVQVVPQGTGSGVPSIAASTPGQSGSALDNITKIIPVGNTGQFAVVSNLPNAGSLATAIQNEVRGTTVQVQTTITAQLNSLTLLNSVALANALRTQVSLPIGQ